MQKHLRMGVAPFLLMIATSAQADQITNLQLYDGSAAPIATISFTNANGTGSNTESVYADPHVSGGTTTPVFYSNVSVITNTAVPEPSSLVIASVSVLFFVVLHWWRRMV